MKTETIKREEWVKIFKYLATKTRDSKKMVWLNGFQLMLMAYRDNIHEHLLVLPDDTVISHYKIYCPELVKILTQVKMGFIFPNLLLKVGDKFTDSLYGNCYVDNADSLIDIQTNSIYQISQIKRGNRVIYS